MDNQETTLKVALKELIREVLAESFQNQGQNREDQQDQSGHRGEVRHPESDRRLKENRGRAA